MPQTGIMWETAGKMRVGVNISWSDIGPGTTHANVHADWYVQTAAWGFNDAQHLSVSGSRASEHDYQMVSGSGQTVTLHVAHHEINGQGLSPGGGPTYTFIGQISGSNNGNPRIERQWTLPARPAGRPVWPNGAVTRDSETPTSFRVFVHPADPNGSPITRYEAYVLTNNAWPGGGGNVVASAAGGTFVATGLNPGGLYYFTARALNDVGWSDWFPMQVVRLPANPPVVGSGYSMRSITRNSATTTGISVTSTGGGTIDNARVQYNTAANETGATVVTRGSWGDVNVTGLTEETVYHYRIAVRNEAGWSAYGLWKTFTTLKDAPDDMAPPTFSLVTDTTMRITWTAPNMNGATFTHYRWELSYSKNFTTAFTSGTTQSLVIDVQNAQPGTTLYARMRAEATPSNGGYGAGGQKTTGIAPNSGTRVHATVGGVVRTGVLYACVGGSIRELRPMVKLMGDVKTE